MAKQKSGRNPLWFSLGLALGALLTYQLTVLQKKSAGRIAQVTAWEHALAERFGVHKAALTAAKVQARYADLFDGRPHFANYALRMHLESHILPGIALYQVLREEVKDSAEALAIVDQCFSAHVQASSMARQTRLVDRLPGGFALLRLANRLVLRTEFPKQGWQIEWVEDSPKRIAYNITGCFYLTVLESYGVPELTAHFCALDDQLYGSLKTIAWERTETLGRGDLRCNFVLRPRD